MYMPAFPVWNAVVQIKVQMRTMNEKENTRRERERESEKGHTAPPLKTAIILLN